MVDFQFKYFDFSKKNIIYKVCTVVQLLFIRGCEKILKICKLFLFYQFDRPKNV